MLEIYTVVKIPWGFEDATSPWGHTKAPTVSKGPKTTKVELRVDLI